MMRIDRMSLRLPHEMQPHASDIAQRVARTLAQARIDHSGTVDRIAVPTIRLDHGATPDDVVRAVSRQVIQQIQENRP